MGMYQSEGGGHETYVGVHTGALNYSSNANLIYNVPVGKYLVILNFYKADTADYPIYLTVNDSDQNLNLQGSAKTLSVYMGSGVSNSGEAVGILTLTQTSNIGIRNGAGSSSGNSISHAITVVMIKL